MTFVTAIDINQWKYATVNVAILETFERAYTYKFFTSCSLTYLRLKEYFRNRPTFVGTVTVDLIQSFMSFMNIKKSLIPNHDWISIATLDRLILPYVEGMRDVDTFVYLDADTMIVSDDVFNLFNVEVSEKGIAAVPSNSKLIDHAVAFSDAAHLLDMVEDNNNTFNAGICVFNKTKMVQNNFIEFLNDVYGRNTSVYVNDELLLNLYDQNFSILEEKYNVKCYMVEDEDYTPYESTIIHFSGKEFKPWKCIRSIKTKILQPYYAKWMAIYRAMH